MPYSPYGSPENWANVMSGTREKAAPHGSARLVQGAMLCGFTTTLFLSAFLLFAVQPMVSRMVLPRLGGSPAVWNTCVCFFQLALLLGYGYADWLAQRVAPRFQVALHAAVLGLALLMLPLSLAGAPPSPDASPILWLLLRLALSIGPPFIAISATAPLLQSWFSRTTSAHAGDPYFLYAASNTGSLLALLSYPFLIETHLGVAAQLSAWSGGFAIVAAGALACGAAMLLTRRATPQAAASTIAAPGGKIPWAEQARWIALSFVPSGLMLAVTTYITTDIAAAPLFWVIPLAIYIATFMLAFGKRGLVVPRFLPLAQAVFIAMAAVTILVGLPGAPTLFIALTAFGLTAMLCHVELARRRPDVQHLTRYFLLISVGGALGGIFNALLAPVLFRGPWEYPLMLAAGCALRRLTTPASAASRPPPAPVVEPATRQTWLRPLLLAVGGLGLVFASSSYAPPSLRMVGYPLAVILPSIYLIRFFRGGAYIGAGIVGLLLVPLLVNLVNSDYSTRSFFGTYRVVRLHGEDLVALQHGTTLHGVRGTRPGEQAEPYGYYARGGPFGRLFTVLHASSRKLDRVGIIGLGVGSLGCYARPGEQWTYFEIDPTVERIARDPRFFGFMANCGNHPAVILGDARQTLASQPPGRLDLLVLDAFSSDAVPAHLLTREALALYRSRLKPGGLLAYHVSNRYLDLVPVVARLAQESGLQIRRLATPGNGTNRDAATEVLVIAAPGTSLDGLAADGWDVPPPGPLLWTDDRSDVVGVIRWR